MPEVANLSNVGSNPALALYLFSSGEIFLLANLQDCSYTLTEC